MDGDMRCPLNLQASQSGICALLAVLAIILCTVLAGPPAAFAQQQQKLSKNELKTLIATAKTPEDHLRLAAYYRDQANDYLARQKQHEADAVVYDSNPRQYPSKYPTAGQHCREWARNDGQSARQALALAEIHEAMAREAAKRR